MNTETKWLAVRALIIAVMLALVLFSDLGAEGLSIGISIVAVMIIVSFVRVRQPEKYEPDERTKKLGAYAASWSWMTSFVLVALLYWVDYLKLAELNPTAVLSMVFFVMAVTMTGFRWYFLKKGDVK